MENINKTNKIVASLTSFLSKESVDLIYNSNNIKYNHCNLYSDFIQSLLSLVFETYLGDELTDDKQRLIHFQWCWNKNLNNFKEENISFQNTKDLYEYFMVFLFEIYYSCNKKGDILSVNVSKMWLDLFDMNKPKTKSDIESFIELYELFDVALLNKVR